MKKMMGMKLILCSLTLCLCQLPVSPNRLHLTNRLKALQSRTKRSPDNLNLQVRLGEQGTPWLHSYHSNYITDPEEVGTKEKVLASVLFQLLAPQFANMAANDLDPLAKTSTADAGQDILGSQASNNVNNLQNPDSDAKLTESKSMSVPHGVEQKRAAEDAQMNIQLDLHVLRDMLRAQAAANRRQLVSSDPLEAKSMKKLFGIGKR